MKKCQLEIVVFVRVCPSCCYNRPAGINNVKIYLSRVNLRVEWSLRGTARTAGGEPLAQRANEHGGATFVVSLPRSRIKNS